MKIVFLTVGETPSLGNLHASQILLPLAELAARGHHVAWLAGMPPQAYVKAAFGRSASGGQLLESCRARGIRFVAQPTAIALGRGWYAYLLHTVLCRRLARRFAPALRRFAAGEPVVLHARSYFAAEVAIHLACQVPQAKVAFDMRSLLAQELPLFFPRGGAWLFGLAKRWEWSLLEQADRAFLPVHKGIELLRAEGVRRLPAFVPIYGLSTAQRASAAALEERLARNTLLYVGTFGRWNDATLLRGMQQTLAEARPGLMLEIASSQSRSCGPDTVIRSYRYEHIHEAYSKALAMLVPGFVIADGFDRLKAASNFFSTKAAEALSMGVPLIVNADIAELADFVLEHGCGMAVRWRGGRFELTAQQREQLASAEWWAQVSANAWRAGEVFLREAVLERYLDHWQAMLAG